LGSVEANLMKGWFGALRFEFLGIDENTIQVWVCCNQIEIA
jgi:hypothetical protein